MSDKHREGFGSIHDKNYFQIFVPCSLEVVIFVLSFPPLPFSQPCVEGRVVEASTSWTFCKHLFCPVPAGLCNGCKGKASSLDTMLLFSTFRNQTEGYHFEHTKSEAHGAAWHSKKETAHLLYS